ncbi:MAG: DUF2306 domain-containing protein [Propionicimonas sp.]
MTTSTSTHRASARWVPFALVALSLVPSLTGSLRLGEFFGGPHLMPYNPRIEASPLPVIVHLVSVIPYAILGAFQFSSRLRRSRPGWHRMAGRVLIPLGLVVAASGLWMTLFYPTQAGTGVLLYVVRLAVATTMAASILLGFAAIRRGDVPRHLAWMTRAYALAVGAGTQAFTGAVRDALLGTSVLANDSSMAAAWVINLAVAEYAIRRSRAVRRQPVALTGR